MHNSLSHMVISGLPTLDAKPSVGDAQLRCVPQVAPSRCVCHFGALNANVAKRKLVDSARRLVPMFVDGGKDELPFTDRTAAPTAAMALRREPFGGTMAPRVTNQRLPLNVGWLRGPVRRVTKESRPATAEGLQTYTHASVCYARSWTLSSSDASSLASLCFACMSLPGGALR